MSRRKKEVFYEYKNKNGKEATGFISPKKAKQVKSFEENAIKKARRKGTHIPEGEK